MAATAPTLALYRALVPAHAAVVDATVEVYLDQAEEQHTQSAWGTRYDAAMVYFAAHLIQRTPGTVASGAEANAEAVGSVVSITTTKGDGASRTSRTERRSESKATGSPMDEELRTTRYGQLYLSIRDSRAVSAPFALGPG